MADIKKFVPINGGSGTLFSDFKIHFSIFRTKRTVAVAYGFVFVFLAFTIFLAFSPSSNPSAPWFTNVSAASTGASARSASAYVSSFFSYFFPNSSSPSTTDSTGSRNVTSLSSDTNTAPSPGINQTQSGDKVDVLKSNGTSILSQKPSVKNNGTNTIPPESSKGFSDVKNQTKSKGLHGEVESLKANQSEAVNSPPPPVASGAAKAEKATLKKKDENVVEDLMKCDLFDGNWVRDDSYPLYKPGSCSVIDEQFNCFLNGRPDNVYHKLKWKPKGCSLPRLNGSHMLELLRGRRLVFVGDSLNRNMWESLICILKNSVKDQKRVYEESGRHHFRTEASYSFVFEDYKCKVELFVSPFLVQEGEIVGKNGTKETLRLDVMGKSADRYKDADIIVFNTGHWWTHDKTSKGKDYYQEGSHVYSELDVNEAFRKALTTWGRWVDANVDPKKSLVFFRGYSASHFSGGQWNSGGQCDHETEPIKNETYLTQYPPKMAALERIFKGMKSHVTYLNITRMTDYRKDGHPSIYRKQHLSDEERRSPLAFQDCSHWCLPGVPDSWNEILYAELLVKLHQIQQQGTR